VPVVQKTWIIITQIKKKRARNAKYKNAKNEKANNQNQINGGEGCRDENKQNA